MKCKRVREALTATGAGAVPALGRHLGTCDACRRYAERLEALRRELRTGGPEVEPDAAFSARLLERLPARGRDQAAELLGWAALRLLPLALMLALLLGAWSLTSSPSPETLMTSVDQDPIAWVIADGTVGP